MNAPDLARRITEATERIASADARLTALLAEIDVLARAEKTIVTEVVRKALDDLSVARDELRALVDEAKP